MSAIDNARTCHDFIESSFVYKTAAKVLLPDDILCLHRKDAMTQSCFLLDDDATVVRFMMPANIWDEIRSRIQEKVNRVSYDTWFIPTTFVTDHHRTVTVRVPNSLFRDWITKHYSSLIAEALEEVHRSDALISFIVAESPDAETREHVVASPDAGCRSIDKRFDRVDHELGAIRRDVGVILARLGKTC